MERPQHPALFEQAIKDAVRIHFGTGHILEGDALEDAISEALEVHEAWITGEPLIAPGEDATAGRRLEHFRAAQLRQLFEAEAMMFGTPDAAEG